MAVSDQGDASSFDKSRAELFEALGHPVRIRILHALQEGPLGFSELKRRIGIESSGHLQFHLGRLDGLVQTSSDGNYSITDDGREALWMADMMQTDGESLRVNRSTTRLNRLTIASALLVALLVAALFVPFLSYSYQVSSPIQTDGFRQVPYSVMEARNSTLFSYDWLVNGSASPPVGFISPYPSYALVSVLSLHEYAVQAAQVSASSIVEVAWNCSSLVDVMVYAPDQFNLFSYNQSGGPMAMATGASSGTLGLSIASPGTYYFVLFNPDGNLFFPNSNSSIAVNMTGATIGTVYDFGASAAWLESTVEYRTENVTTVDWVNQTRSTSVSLFDLLSGRARSMFQSSPFNSTAVATDPFKAPMTYTKGADESMNVTIVVVSPVSLDGTVIDPYGVSHSLIPSHSGDIVSLSYYAGPDDPAGNYTLSVELTSGASTTVVQNEVAFQNFGTPSTPPSLHLPLEIYNGTASYDNSTSRWFVTMDGRADPPQAVNLTEVNALLPNLTVSNLTFSFVNNANSTFTISLWLNASQGFAHGQLVYFVIMDSTANTGFWYQQLP